ncbi:unnamed protein product, partial [Ixodes pacificus]
MERARQGAISRQGRKRRTAAAASGDAPTVDTHTHTHGAKAITLSVWNPFFYGDGHGHPGHPPPCGCWATGGHLSPGERHFSWAARARRPWRSGPATVARNRRPPWPR